MYKRLPFWVSVVTVVFYFLVKDEIPGAIQSVL